MNYLSRNNTKSRSWILLLILLIIAFALGYAIRGGPSKTDMPEQEAGEKAQIKFWTCSMHPQIKQPGPGQCPICGMDLIPVSSGNDDEKAGLREHKLSEYAMKLAEIQTLPVEKKFVTAEIRMVGKVDYDETRLSYITAWVPGRIEKLYVDFTGVKVKKGDHMVSLYSPELLAAQQELLLGLKMQKSSSSRMKKSSLENVEATREKLNLWGLTREQIREIEKIGKVSDYTTIFSPVSGIVVHKNGFEGMYVETGTRIYTVADLSHVWIKLDAYESDLGWIRYGQEVEFKTKAYPGEKFNGKITFIDPILNPQTRTVKVRVNLLNPDGKLKPEMFVSATIFSKVAADGRVIDPYLKGKWICPMHPEIVKDTKGSCDICGMPLVTAESLGYVSADEELKEPPLVIPATAPLITGKRAVVYVALPDKQGAFEGREVVLGPRAGDYYLVKEGLSEGERVVVNGNFKIDSAVQILAKPSMMSPEGQAPTGHQHEGKAQSSPSQKPDKAELKLFDDVPEKFKLGIDGLAAAYYQLHHALSHDDFESAVEGAQSFLKALEGLDMKNLKGNAHMEWMRDQKKLKQYAETAKLAENIADARAQFDELSDVLYAVIKKFGTSGSLVIYRFYCPMANDGSGTYWLQDKTETENPYYGKAMLKCGSRVETISQGKHETELKGKHDE